MCWCVLKVFTAFRVFSRVLKSVSGVSGRVLLSQPPHVFLPRQLDELPAPTPGTQSLETNAAPPGSPPVSPLPFVRKGTRVELDGLNVHSELNGHQGVV